MAEWKRANYVPAPGYYLLNQACAIIWKAFPNGGLYLVGSSLERKDWRDIDVRLMLPDEEYDRLFKDPEAGWLNPLWSLLCVSISQHLRDATGLPVDFQIQRSSNANEKHPGLRSAIGLFHDYPGERPTETEPRDEQAKP